jgi:hypothetical protein
MTFQISCSKKNIICNQEDENIQNGGYEEIKNNKIIELWQNPDFNDEFINFYLLVNRYLRGLQIEIKDKWLKILKLNSTQDFYDFMIYYINKLTNIIHKNISTKKRIFYRGEFRKNFNYHIGDTIFYSTFQSVSSSISTAFKFSQGSKNDINLLFVIEIPENFCYKELNTKLKLYNYKEKVTEYIDEKEFLIMPNSYYVIVDKFIIYNNTNAIKMRMYHQDFHKIENKELYKEKYLLINKKDTKNFQSSELNNFVSLTKKYQKNIDYLNSLNSYKIFYKFYDILQNPNLDNLFNLNMIDIEKKLLEIDVTNIKEIAEEIKKLGIGYLEYEIRNLKKYEEKINNIKLILNTQFNIINKLTVYSGYYNYNNLFKTPDFIELLNRKKINEEFEYNKILVGHNTIDKYLYKDIYNQDPPNNKIKKNNKTSLLYYKYLIKYEAINVKLCVSDIHEYKNDDYIILIPNFKMKIIKNKKILNDYKLPCIYYEIMLLGL